jgi:ParB-like chromosome segregation protein Spo0J
MKKIIIKNPANLPLIPFKVLRDMYEANGLKQKENRDVSGLKRSILKLGFKVPLFIWDEGKYIIDGAGRIMALGLLEYEGYEIPDIPCLIIQADSLEDAKVTTLAVTSEYGEVTEESIGAFTFKIDPITYDFAKINNFKMDEIKWTPPKIKTAEVAPKLKGKTKLEHECPACGHKFNTA